MTRGSDSLLAVGGEGDVRCACVASVERPFGLAMADDKASWGRHPVGGIGEEGDRRKGERRTKEVLPRPKGGGARDVRRCRGCEATRLDASRN